MSQPSVQTATDRAKDLYQTRRRSAQTPTAEGNQFHRELPRLFSGRMASGSSTGSGDSSDSDEGYGSGFMAQATNYSRMMHQHTRSQMRLGTLPGYTKTMHAFTKNQMNHFVEKRRSKSEQSSPHVAASHAMLPQKLAVDLTRLQLDEEPGGPANSPEVQAKQPEGFAAGAQRRRSLTDPVSLSRDFAAIDRKDFAAALVK